MTTSTSVDFVIDVSGYFANPTSTSVGLAYEPLAASVRLVDSRTPAGSCVPTACAPLAAAVRQRVQVAGQGAIPSTATAVVADLTILNPGADETVQINPDGSAGMGTLADGKVVFDSTATNRNSLVMVPLKADGTIEIVANHSADWLLDVTGYLAQPTSTYAYRYDTTGTRASKTDPTGATTEFTYSAGAGLPLLLRQKTGSASTWVIYGPGGQPIEQIDSAGTATWLHHDQLGSVRLSTSSTDGTEVSRRTFNAYGTVKAQSGTQPLLGYAGQYTDGETGFQYLRARYYDPVTGQFISVDPLIGATRSPVDYAASNPSVYSDMSGKWPGSGFVKKHWRDLASRSSVDHRRHGSV
ncbi:RHS repeat-associated core domain-containing protein [Aquihabitans sp. McL0605]|uniref:RHS repeat-associated core domain-containing protein n=1 Tax=Aquihabitans sp. McL0605 TaxID=3415671 RepID=UPI003CEBE6E3